MSSSPSSVRAALVVAAALTLSSMGCGSTPAGSGGPDSPSGGAAGGDLAKVGSPAPDFTAEVIGGDGPKSIKEATGKVVIVDFWATFCGPCKKSFPAYQKIVDDGGGDVVVIAISVDEPDNASKEQIAEFAKSAGVKFAIVWDKEGSIRGKKYEVPKMPTSYIVDKAGVVRHMHAGYEEGEDAKIADQVKELLK